MRTPRHASAARQRHTQTLDAQPARRDTKRIDSAQRAASTASNASQRDRFKRTPWLHMATGGAAW